MASYRQILITDARLASLPTSGTAYNNMKSYADGSTVLQRPISLHDNNLETDNAALANAILWRKTGTSSYQDRACNACYDAIGGEDRSGDNPQILPVGRHACNFVLAADIGEMHTWDATKFAAFKTWSNTLRTKQAGSGGGGSIEGVTTNRVNNWAATAWASRIALEIFNDVGGTNLPSAAAVNLIQGWMGDPTKRSNLWPSSGGCWYYGTSPMAGGVGPTGYTATVHGHASYSMSGCIHDDMRRGAGDSLCPSSGSGSAEISHYVRTYGCVMWAAEMLRLRGYPSMTWVSSALQRVAVWVKTYADTFGISPWYGDSDDCNAAWMGNYLYDLGYPTTATSPHKTSMSFCDYLFAGTIGGSTPTTIFEGASNPCSVSHTNSTYQLTAVGQIPLSGTTAATAVQDASTYVLILAGNTFTGTNTATVSHTSSTHRLVTVTTTSTSGTNSVEAVVYGTARRYWSNDGGRSFITEWLEGNYNNVAADHSDSGFLLTSPIVHILTGLNSVTVTHTGTFNVLDSAQIQDGINDVTVTHTFTAVYEAPPDLHDSGDEEVTVDNSRSTFYLSSATHRPQEAKGDVRTTEKLLGENVLVGEMRTSEYYDVDDNDFGVTWRTTPGDKVWQYHEWIPYGEFDFDTDDGWSQEVGGGDPGDYEFDSGKLLFYESGHEVVLLSPGPYDFGNQIVDVLIESLLEGATAYFRADLRDGEFGIDSIWIEHYGDPGVIRAGKTIAGGEEILATFDLPTPIDEGMMRLRSQDSITYWEYRNTAADTLTVIWSETTPMDDRGTILRLVANTDVVVLAVNST